MALTTLHVTPHLRIASLLAVQHPSFHAGYEHGVAWSVCERATTGPLEDRYLPDLLTEEIEHRPFLFSAPYEQDLCWQVGLWLGMIHGGVLLPDGRLHPDAPTLVSLHDRQMTRGYAAGRCYFFVETETDDERITTDTSLLAHLRELATEYGTYEEKQATLRYSVGGLLGKLSGHLFPWTIQEQGRLEQESLRVLGYVEPLPQRCLARRLVLQPA